MTTSPLFLVALRSEALALRLGAPAAQAERIGMGPVHAVAATVRIGRSADRRPVVLVGCAGGLDPSLRPGDLVVATAVLEAARPGAPAGPDPVVLSRAGEVAELLRGEASITDRNVTVHLGPVVSSPKILHGSAAREGARSGGAVAVDMESLWCAPLARSRPFAVVRVVLDVPGRDLFSASTPFVALRCARSLAAAARALVQWHPVPLDDNNLLEVGEH